MMNLYEVEVFNHFPPMSIEELTQSFYDVQCQYELAQRYHQGKGVEKNVAEAVKWYELGARQRFHNAYVTLGTLYEDGEDVAKDWGKAIFWYHKAAQQGNPNMMFYLGELFYRGTDVKKDLRQLVTDAILFRELNIFLAAL